MTETRSWSGGDCIPTGRDCARIQCGTKKIFTTEDTENTEEDKSLILSIFFSVSSVSSVVKNEFRRIF
jgi:hypothetical protein